MQKSLQRQDGVAKVDVNLLERWIEIYPKPDFKLDPAKIWKLVKDSGITMDEMSIVAEGTIVGTPGGGLVLKVSTSGQEYPIADEAQTQPLRELADTNRVVQIRGQLYKKTKDAEKIQPGEQLALRNVESINE